MEFSPNPLGLPLVYCGDYNAPQAESGPLPTGEFTERRRAARAVIVEADGGVWLVHATKHHYYKLPGGGLEADESVPAALMREVNEEAGLLVRIGQGIGYTVQYDVSSGFLQESYAYEASVLGRGQTNPTATELDAGFQPVRLGSLASAHAAILSGLSSPHITGRQHSMIYREAAIIAALHAKN